MWGGINMEDLKWIDLVNGESDVDADDINKLAKYIKELNENKPDKNDVAIDVDDKLSADSLNPVQNKVVTKALGEKVDKEDGKGLSTNDYTDEDKEKLNNIEDGANKTVVDSELSETSTNPVQNKVLIKALDNYANALKGTASGEVIRVDDVSPLEHELKVMVKNKNLIPQPYNYNNIDYKSGDVYEQNGITYTINDDYSITMI